MRWLAGLVVVLAAIAGALYGVGYFLLPNTLDVTHTVVVERPRATVFAQVNDLTAAQNWSPFYVRDPGADYSFSGAPGEGQSMRWDGADPSMGDGELVVARAAPPRGVRYLLRIADRAVFDVDVFLTAGMAQTRRVTNVEARVIAECPATWMNIPCRYMNLIIRRQVERELDVGLDRLKAMSEALPDVDFEGLAPEFVTLAPQPYLYIPVTVTRAQLGEFMPASQSPVTPAASAAVQRIAQEDADRATQRRVAAAMEQARARAEAALQANDLVRAGPLVRVTTLSNEERFAFRVGYPYAGPAPLSLTGEEVGETPSGRVMRIVHNGTRDNLAATYARAFAYLEAHHVERRGDGLPWEVVLSDSDPTAVRIEIYYPIQ
ncbi:MAG: hypothetical protein AB7J28_13760 [Hyphomonadaceae bacterium]